MAEGANNPFSVSPFDALRDAFLKSLYDFARVKKGVRLVVVPGRIKNQVESSEREICLLPLYAAEVTRIKFVSSHYMRES